MYISFIRFKVKMIYNLKNKTNLWTNEKLFLAEHIQYNNDFFFESGKTTQIEIALNMFIVNYNLYFIYSIHRLK